MFNCLSSIMVGEMYPDTCEVNLSSVRLLIPRCLVAYFLNSLFIVVDLCCQIYRFIFVLRKNSGQKLHLAVCPKSCRRDFGGEISIKTFWCALAIGNFLSFIRCFTINLPEKVFMPLSNTLTPWKPVQRVRTKVSASMHCLKSSPKTIFDRIRYICPGYCSADFFIRWIIVFGDCLFFKCLQVFSGECSAKNLKKLREWWHKDYHLVLRVISIRGKLNSVWQRTEKALCSRENLSFLRPVGVEVR